VECGFGEQRQRVRLLLLERRRFRGNVSHVGIGASPVCTLIQRLTRGIQRLDQKLADLGLEPPEL
jgi:hypothetical protein